MGTYLRSLNVRYIPIYLSPGTVAISLKARLHKLSARPSHWAESLGRGSRPRNLLNKLITLSRETLCRDEGKRQKRWSFKTDLQLDHICRKIGNNRWNSSMRTNMDKAIAILKKRSNFILIYLGKHAVIFFVK